MCICSATYTLPYSVSWESLEAPKLSDYQNFTSKTILQFLKKGAFLVEMADSTYWGGKYRSLEHLSYSVRK